MITKCLCGLKLRNDGANANETTGICLICWRLVQDQRWYRKNGFRGIADHIKATLHARELKGRKSKRKEEDDENTT